MSEQTSGGHEPSPQISEIARLNDQFRRTATRDFFITPGVQKLPDVPSLVQAVRDFSTFTPDNDPFGEYDFGSINWQNEKTFWKIDYYDQALRYFVDPLSPECRRVMTILLAEEY